MVAFGMFTITGCESIHGLFLQVLEMTLSRTEMELAAMRQEKDHLTVTCDHMLQQVGCWMMGSHHHVQCTNGYLQGVLVSMHVPYSLE